MTKNVKQKALANFWLAVLPYMTGTGWAYLNDQRNKEKEELEGLKSIIEDRLKE